MSLRSSPQPMSDGSWDKTSLAPSPFGWENWGIHFTVSQTFPIGLGSSHPVVVGLSLSFIGYLPSLSHFPTPPLLFSVLPKETVLAFLSHSMFLETSKLRWRPVPSLEFGCYHSHLSSTGFLFFLGANHLSIYEETLLRPFLVTFLTLPSPFLFTQSKECSIGFNFLIFINCNLAFYPSLSLLILFSPNINSDFLTAKPNKFLSQLLFLWIAETTFFKFHLPWLLGHHSLDFPLIFLTIPLQPAFLNSILLQNFYLNVDVSRDSLLRLPFTPHTLFWW